MKEETKDGLLKCLEFIRDAEECAAGLRCAINRLQLGDIRGQTDTRPDDYIQRELKEIEYSMMEALDRFPLPKHPNPNRDIKYVHRKGIQDSLASIRRDVERIVAAVENDEEVKDYIIHGFNSELSALITGFTSSVVSFAQRELRQARYNEDYE